MCLMGVEGIQFLFQYCEKCKGKQKCLFFSVSM